MAESCKGCKFWRPLSGGGGLHACHFLLDTGILRCYPAEECIYNTKGMNDMPKGERIPSEVIGQIELMSAEGKTSPQICETLGVSSSTVTRVRNKMKEKSPAAAATATEENALITDTPIIADTAGNVKRNPSAVTQEDIPGIVRETIAREIDNLSNELEMLAERIKKVKANKTELEKWYLGTAPHIRYREENTE